MEALVKLVEYLKNKRYYIVRTIKVEDTNAEHDQTYGYPVLAEFETVDFDALLQAIDEFSNQFHSDTKD